MAKQRLGVDHLDDHTRGVIDRIVAVAQQRQQRTRERELELQRSLAIEI